ncbi:hypothetical protein ACE7GA_26425 (plasmid) [Roseomonas sp. CCTCC AB2023176]|uniref:hypothetical protein n=1 Tax=Roseomonas sp. CCTCC AB2023176 TaxID=3342640 RepID=UPI0035DBD5B4
MSWGRGLFRLWVFVSALWLVTVGVSLALELKEGMFAGNYQYVMQLRTQPWETDFNHPIYEIAHPPGQGPFPEKFMPVDWQHLADWNSRVSDRNMVKMDFPDRTALYLSAQWSEADQTQLSRMFWEGRWWRYADRLWPWAIRAVAPPLVLLSLWMAVGWVLRGFRARPGAAG